MTRKFLAFDIETVTPFPEGEEWRDHRPLGIGCAAGFSSTGEAYRWSGYANPNDTPDGIAERMTPDQLQDLVSQLSQMVQNGYTIVTWNGMGFDFDVLAEESQMTEECKELALGHVDMMFHLFCVKGYPLALSTAAKGMNTQDKTEGMDGAKATVMWAEGERRAVIEYCVQDTRSTLDLATACEDAKALRWISRTGRPNYLYLPKGWFTVRESLEIPRPDTSWMSDPIPRSTFTNWLSR